MERNLASIQKITSLSPIEGADSIEKAVILGWELVVKKGEFSVGDLVVYCEIDSVLPERPEFEFLKPRGMRIKTVRLRGQVSQGIAFPLSVLGQDALDDINLYPTENGTIEGIDVTEILGVTKYEPSVSAQLTGIAKGKFPSFIPKTDEPRVQTLTKVLSDFNGQISYITEKIDGSSVTYYLKDDVFGVCSRNLDLKEDKNNSFWKVAKALEIEKKLRSLGINIAIQGELIGEGIQKNKLKIKGQTVKIFNAYDIDKAKYYSYLDFIDIVKNSLGLETVPIISDKFTIHTNIGELVNLAIRKSSINPEKWAEGIVIRPLIESWHREIGRVSFKVINPEFLIDYGE